jgi:hypothetical protein
VVKGKGSPSFSIIITLQKSQTFCPKTMQKNVSMVLSLLDYYCNALLSGYPEERLRLCLDLEVFFEDSSLQ